MIEHYLHNKFIEWDVRFISVIDHADTNDEGNKRSRQISGLVNEWYCEETSRSVRRILQNKRMNGQFTGSFAAYGYLVDPADKHHLIPDPGAAPVVGRIYAMYLSGCGYKKIAETLNNEGIPNPTEYKHRGDSRYVNRNADKSPDSGLWTLSTIASILHNEVYMGTLAQGRTHYVSYKNHHRKKVPKEDWIRTVNAHDAIVSEADWHRVQEMLGDKTHRGSTVTGDTPALSGRVRCAVCGRPMKRGTYYNKAHTARYYNLRCAAVYKGTKTCPNSSAISGIELEAQLVEAINSHIEEYCAADAIVIADDLADRLKACRRSLETIDAEISKKQSYISKAYEDKLDGSIGESEYRAHSAKFMSDIAKLTEERDRAAARIAAMQAELADPEDNSDTISRYCHIDKLDYSIVSEFISTVYIGAKGSDGSREIRIDWNF